MEMTNELSATVERLAAAAGMLQQAAERLAERENEAESTLQRIVAEADARSEMAERLAATEAKLAAAEARIAELSAYAPATVTNHGRKTLPPAMSHLLAKQGVTGESIASMEAGAVDAALSSLSLEQRIAVKAQLLRAGLLA